MSKFDRKEYDGIFYRLNQVSILAAKAPLYIKNPRALELCLEKIKNELDFLKMHLNLQNIQDWEHFRKQIDQAISSDVNNSPNFRIIGHRETCNDQNGSSSYQYNFEIIITE